MNRKNVWILALLLIGIGGLTAVEGFVKPSMNERAVRYEAGQNDPFTHDIKPSLAYANKYMGNAGNFINLNATLPLRKIEKTFQLYPERLAAEIRYQAPAGNLGPRELNAFLMYNSTANFVLIDNLEELALTFEDQGFTIRREDVAAWYVDVNDLAQLRDVGLWEEFVHSRLAEPNAAADFVETAVKRTVQTAPAASYDVAPAYYTMEEQR